MTSSTSAARATRTTSNPTAGGGRPARPLPQRTCIACRSTTGKRELIRIVRTPAGSVEIDATGKKAGRGAYLHNSEECWETAIKKDRLSAALKTKVGAEDRRRLVDFLNAMKASPV
jgi:predicted RNA-binding protein YlxR (DUF448 family)